MIFSVHTPFRERRMEWWFAVVTTSFGIWLCIPPISMSTAAFAGLLVWATEMQWGVVFLVSGFMHLVALYINGRRWWTPFIRTLVLSISAMCYAVFSLGFVLEYWATTATFTYSSMSSAALLSMYYSIKDCVHALEVRNGIY